MCVAAMRKFTPQERNEAALLVGDDAPTAGLISDCSGSTDKLKARFSSIELIPRDFENESPETTNLTQRQLVSIAELRMEMAQLAKLHAMAARFYKRRYYLLMLPSIILSISIATVVGLLPDSGVGYWYNEIIVSVLSAPP